jgi:hypothetical protein
MSDIATQEAARWTGANSIISAENYICPDFAKREAEGLWKKVWQMACREEEIQSSVRARVSNTTGARAAAAAGRAANLPG